MTVVDICNMALDHLGKTTITDLDEGSNEAKRCKRQFDTSRRLALAYSPWTFSTRTVALAQLTTNAHSGVWEYSYDLPNDSLQSHMRVLEEAEPPRSNTPPPQLHIEAGAVFCNVTNARLFYTFDQTVVEKWSPQFTEAVSLMLAYRIAPGMTRRRSDVRDFYEGYMDAVAKAVEMDAGQVPMTYVWSGGYVDARDAGGRHEGPQTDGSSIWGP